MRDEAQEAGYRVSGGQVGGEFIVLNNQERLLLMDLAVEKNLDVRLQDLILDLGTTDEENRGAIQSCKRGGDGNHRRLTPRPTNRVRGARGVLPS